LPAASDTVQITIVVPTGKVTGALLVAEPDTEQLSEVVGVPRATPLAVQSPASGFTATSAGAVMLGAWLSTTVTVCVAVAVLPDASVAVQITVVAPSGNVAGALLEAVAEQLSATVAVPSDTPLAVQSPASAFTVTAAGAVMVGFTLSTTVTVCVAVVVLPDASVAVQITVVRPTGKLEGALFAEVAPVQLSVTVALPRVTPVALQVADSTQG